MNDEIVISYPQYAYELQAQLGGVWEYWDAGNEFHYLVNATRHKQLMITRYGYNWRVVRSSDKVIIAQKRTTEDSKIALRRKIARITQTTVVTPVAESEVQS